MLSWPSSQTRIFAASFISSVKAALRSYATIVIWWSVRMSSRCPCGYTINSNFCTTFITFLFPRAPFTCSLYFLLKLNLFQVLLIYLSFSTCNYPFSSSSTSSTFSIYFPSSKAPPTPIPHPRRYLPPVRRCCRPVLEASHCCSTTPPESIHCVVDEVDEARVDDKARDDDDEAGADERDLAESDGANDVKSDCS